MADEMAKSLDEPGTYEQRLEAQRKKVVACVVDYLTESRQVEKEPRAEINTRNWGVYYGDIDWGDVPEGHQRVHLPAVAIQAEQHRAKDKRNLTNFDKYIAVELAPGVAETRPQMVMSEYAAKNLLRDQFRKAKAQTAISDAIMIATLECRFTLRAMWNAEEKRLDLETRLFNQYHEDPETCSSNKKKLYCMEELSVNYFSVLALAAEEPTSGKPYRMEACKRLQPWGANDQGQQGTNEAQGQPDKPALSGRRKQVRIHNFYGTLLDQETGEVMQWEKAEGVFVPLENVFLTLGNEQELLRDPVKNPLWIGSSPFVSALLVRAPGPANRAALDSAADLNEIYDDLFSMALTGSFKSVHNVLVAWERYIKNKEALSGGIKDGATLILTHDAPAAAVDKILSAVKTGDYPPDAQAMIAMIQRLLPEAGISNQIDIGGALPSKEVRATEVVASQRAIGSVDESIAEDLEVDVIAPLAEVSFGIILQNSNDLTEGEIRAAFGEGGQDRADVWLQMTPRQRFEDCQGAFLWRGKGLRGQAVTAARGQALVNLMSVVGSNPLLIDLLKTTYSIPKMFAGIVRGFQIDPEDLELSQREQQQQDAIAQIREQAVTKAEADRAAGGGSGNGGGGAPGAGNPSLGAPKDVSGEPGSGQGMM